MVIPALFYGQECCKKDIKEIEFLISVESCKKKGQELEVHPITDQMIFYSHGWIMFEECRMTEFPSWL